MNKFMFTGFEKIVEERIKKAQRDGLFEKLPGRGQPLPKEDANIPDDIRMAYKILKNADCIPPELEIKKEIKTTQALLSGMEDTAEKYKILKKLNFLILKLNSMRNAAIDFDIPQQYMDPLADQMASRASSKKTAADDT